ncbi:MAG TPA: glycosyltransferase [Rhizobiaceae bacterium]|nr:glycosyltransferase [Rhizobiaceae bacterium]
MAAGKTETGAGDSVHAIAVLLPCYNEALTIGDVVTRFRAALPTARIFVYDNNSSDDTALRARLAGAEVVRERRQGKGNVVRRMFSDIEADIYIMADGDGTYAPEDAPELVRTLITERADMVVGTRAGVRDDAGRAGHAFGNALFNRIFAGMFGPDFTDILSGYRAFTRRYVKSFPALSAGFEIETEMSVHAWQLRMPVAEIALPYGRRPEGSTSKLSTVRDGLRIARMFALAMKETQPLRFFGMLAAMIGLLGVIFMLAPVMEFAMTGLVSKMPTWIGAVGLMIVAVLLAMSGLILDSVARGRAEQKRSHYLSLGALQASRVRAVENAIAEGLVIKAEKDAPATARTARKAKAA